MKKIKIFPVRTQIDLNSLVKSKPNWWSVLRSIGYNPKTQPKEIGGIGIIKPKPNEWSKHWCRKMYEDYSAMTKSERDEIAKIKSEGIFHNLYSKSEYHHEEYNRNFHYGIKLMGFFPFLFCQIKKRIINTFYKIWKQKR